MMKLRNDKLLRQKAEEYLKKKLGKASGQANEYDVMKLLYELQVHQIELEMQNEELRQANESTEEARKKYIMLYEFAPMGYFTLDKKGVISELNITGAEILDEKRISVINSNLKLYLTKDSQPVFNDFMESVYSTLSKESCEVEVAYKDKTCCPLYMEGIVIADEQKCLLSVVDISSFKK